MRCDVHVGVLLDAAVVNAAFAGPNCGGADDDIGQPHLVTSHLNPLPLTGVADQIRRNAEFLTNTYGSDGSPFFRPPHGVHNPDIDQVAADAGYTTLTLWSADIGNSRPENETTLISNATKAFGPQQVVLAHANLPTITRCYAQQGGPKELLIGHRREAIGLSGRRGMLCGHR